MTEWENHETDSKYLDSLVFKLFCFQFVNSYSSLFYIAFIKGSTNNGCENEDCMKELELQLATIFITNLFLNIVEIGLPLFNNHRTLKKRINQIKGSGNSLSSEEKQSIMSKYETTLEDYMEMVIGYGYLILFGVAFPFVPLICLFLAMVEVRVDAWKFCNLTTRPIPKQDNSIGIWTGIIQTIAYIGSAVNIGIVLFTANSFDISDSSTKWIIFISIEHSLFVFKSLLSSYIPDVPQVVSDGIEWSKRVVDEKLYGKLSDIDKERTARNLKFVTVDSTRLIKIENIFTNLS
jgi:Calcium-activated chloride channel